MPGAGDDADNWAHGLSPAQFWHHREALCQPALHPDVVETRVLQIVHAHAQSAGCEFCVLDTNAVAVSASESLARREQSPAAATPEDWTRLLLARHFWPLCASVQVELVTLPVSHISAGIATPSTHTLIQTHTRTH